MNGFLFAYCIVPCRKYFAGNLPGFLYTAVLLFFLSACGGNVVQVSTDTTAPVITLNGSNPQNVAVGGIYSEAGATAVDDFDGNVTVTTSGTVDTNTIGTYTITYTAADISGNTATAIRSVIVTSALDTTVPVITLNGSNTQNIVVGGIYSEAGATAVDDFDGNVTITISGTVDTNTIGTYTITYTATDVAGNIATETRTILVATDVIEVDIGQDSTILINSPHSLTANATLNGGAPGNVFTYSWSQQASPGQGDVIFSDADKKDTTITVTQPGSYFLVLEVVYDGKKVSDKVTITVNAPASGATGLATRPANAGACVAPSGSGGGGSTVKLIEPFPQLPGLSQPLAMYKEPGGNRWLVVQKEGKIVQFNDSPSVSNHTDFIDISSRVHTDHEMGLLDLAFHPDYQNNKFIYLSYNHRAGNKNYSIISRFKLTSNNEVLDPSTETEILRQEQPGTTHNGGQIHFSPLDGTRLYISFGDGGGEDARKNGQNKNTWLGAILRIDVENGTGDYTIPADNPFANGGGSPEMFAWGFRNPWRWSFDSAGKIWAGDVGENHFEEINFVEKGKNYGWALMEGNDCFEYNCNQSGLTLPVFAYPHSGSASVTGGYVYRGSAIPGLYGQYIFSDYSFGTIWKMETSGQYTVSEIVQSGGGIVSFAEDNQGELYGVNINVGKIYKLVVDDPGDSAQIPDQLSEWGCFRDNDTETFSDNVIPYDMNALLWTDNANKHRFIAIPDGTTIDIDTEGRFVFPKGSVLGKHFRLNGNLIETRIWLRYNTGAWEGFSYEWNSGGTDATLLKAAKDKIIDGQNWHYPSTAECAMCHTPIATFAIGPEVGQLNRTLTYPSTGLEANQLITLESIGVLTSLTNEQKGSVFYAIDDASYSEERRSRSYLHSNCAGCHQPGGPGSGDIDLRFATDFGSTRLCNQAPYEGGLGVNNPVLIKPGDPDNSILMMRIEDMGDHRMPPLGTEMADNEAITVLRKWITDLETCS